MSRDLHQENSNLREALTEARDQILQMEAFIQKLEEGPRTLGYVISIQGERVAISTHNGLFEVYATDDLVKRDKLKIGDGVLYNGGGFITSKSLKIPDIGRIQEVQSVDPEGTWIEVEGESTPLRIVTKKLSKPYEVGDRVLVDGGRGIALENYGKANTKFSFTGDTGITWDDIGGLEDAKAALQQAIELPSIHPELFKRYGKAVSKGAMLWGPTGCGKTLLAKACATSLAKIFGKKAQNTGFIYVKGPELLNMYVGNTEASIRSLFRQAYEHKKMYGYPAILFIDECDALLGERGKDNSHILSQTVVPQFLSEMDGLTDSGAFVLLATNRPDTLDPAITRDGRIDRKIPVLRPNMESAMQIMKIHFKGKPVQGDVNEMVSGIVKELYSDSYALYNAVYTHNDEVSTTKMCLRHLVNGAMVANIVDMAAGAALRDISVSNTPRSSKDIARSVSGISMNDLLKALNTVFEENKNANHNLSIQEFEDSLKGSIRSITRAQ